MPYETALDLVGAGVEEDGIEDVLGLDLRLPDDVLVDAHTHVAGVGVDKKAVGVLAPGAPMAIRALNFKSL